MNDGLLGTDAEWKLWQTWASEIGYVGSYLKVSMWSSFPALDILAHGICSFWVLHGRIKSMVSFQNGIRGMW